MSEAFIRLRPKMIAIRPFSMIICREEGENWRQSALRKSLPIKAICIGRGLKKSPLFHQPKSLTIEYCFEFSSNSRPKTLEFREMIG
jgi:hypothetical protein